MKKLLCPEFVLGDKVTPEQAAFFHKNGVIIFRNVLKPETVAFFIQELNRIEKKLLDEGVDKINGVPLKFGKDHNGQTIIQRLCFLSTFSSTFHEFLQDPRLVALLELLAPYEGRIAEHETDGLLLNHGIHLDPCPFESGGLRVLPGTHTQGVLRLLFKKKYFIDNNPDAREIGFDINAGDLTVHDGRIWHRAQQSPYVGEASRRRVMYVPIITGKYMPKDENSKTPFYHRFASKVQN